MKAFLTILALILLKLIVIAIGGCIFWGIGLLAIRVFGINYNWAILHGLICELAFIVLKQIFSK